MSLGLWGPGRPTKGSPGTLVLHVSFLLCQAGEGKARSEHAGSLVPEQRARE